MTLQLDWTTDELLATHDLAEPLVAGGVRCHGGFASDGTYVSPRTKGRVPAIEAWQQHHTATFGTKLLDVPLETWPEHYPNVTQAKFLVAEGVRQPMISILTRIGTVEGFGAMIRNSIIPDLQACFDEDVRSSAIAHLPALYEAHARDEAGFGDEAGHKEMWFAARDIAFEHPVTGDETQLMLERMGIAQPGGGVDLEKLRADALARRLLPDDISFELESLIERMIRILLIEVQAFHTFVWAEELLSDRTLVAGEGEAARLVSYVRADETPHVEYLKTVLTEMRDRTFVGASGTRYPGTDMVGRLWDRAVSESLGPRRDEAVAVAKREVAHAVEGHADAADILHRFDELATDQAA